jgi:hypothetical protein
MLCAVDLGIADQGEGTGGEQAAQIAIALLGDIAEPALPPLECCFGTSPIQAEKFGPGRKRRTWESATLATRAVASAGPMPGIASNRLLISLDRCRAMIIRSCEVMSAMGHEQTSRHVRAMSVIPIKADIRQRIEHVCFVPIADIGN